MCKLEYHQGSFSALLGVGLLSFVYFLLVMPSVADPIAPAIANPNTSQNLIVSTNVGLVSVKAAEASLKDIIERIGQGTGHRGRSAGWRQRESPAEFRDLTLDQAMERLSGNYAYTTDSDGSRVSWSSESLLHYLHGNRLEDTCVNRHQGERLMAKNWFNAIVGQDLGLVSRWLGEVPIFTGNKCYCDTM